MSSKGSSFERDVCKQLSLWWGGRDDIFWRTSMSGGRATVRGKTGRKTHGQYGDISATHPRGNSLMKLLTIELKRGYSKHSVLDIIEKDNEGSCWWEFIKQARRAARLAGTKYWWLIVKRDYHETMLYMPKKFVERLTFTNPKAVGKLIPHMVFSVSLKSGKTIVVGACRFKDFLNHVIPADVVMLMPSNENQD